MTLRQLAGFADGAGSGPLLPALAVSVALHAALLAGLPDLWAYSERPATAPLNAWLVPGARTAAVVEPPPAVAPVRERDAFLAKDGGAPRDGFDAQVVQALKEQAKPYGILY